MADEAERTPYKLGERLAQQLVIFVEDEFSSDSEAIASALHGAYDELDFRTRLIRGLDPWPAPPDEDQDRSN